MKRDFSLSSTLPSNLRLLFDRKAAALILSLSVRTLDSYIASGEIKVRRIGGRVLIHYTTLEAFAELDHRTPADMATSANQGKAA